MYWCPLVCALNSFRADVSFLYLTHVQCYMYRWHLWWIEAQQWPVTHNLIKFWVGSMFGADMVNRGCTFVRQHCVQFCTACSRVDSYINWILMILPTVRKWLCEFCQVWMISRQCQRTVGCTCPAAFIALAAILYITNQHMFKHTSTYVAT